MTDNAKTTAGDAEVGAVTRTIEQLSGVAARGPIIFTQVLGGLLLVLGVADLVAAVSRVGVTEIQPERPVVPQHSFDLAEDLNEIGDVGVGGWL